MENIVEEVKQIIEKYAYDKKLVKESTTESKIISDLKINSARIVDIILDLEEKYDIMIEDSVLEKLKTINDIVQLIQTKLKNKSI
ncbi:MAG: phosphopantetheine-binding protein [Salinivirgaceae bacterium]|nr:phosphopantetheine-binding protein [Salinivirgaceae bacterium]